VTIYRFTVSCIDHVMGCVYILYTAAYLEFKRCLERMYELNETM